jgi:hypothetical protein
MAAIGSPATANLCQMRTVNATLVRSVKIRTHEAIYREMDANTPEFGSPGGSSGACPAFDAGWIPVRV